MKWRCELLPFAFPARSARRRGVPTSCIHSSAVAFSGPRAVDTNTGRCPKSLTHEQRLDRFHPSLPGRLLFCTACKSKASPTAVSQGIVPGWDASIDLGLFRIRICRGQLLHGRRLSHPQRFGEADKHAPRTTIPIPTNHGWVRHSSESITVINNSRMAMALGPASRSDVAHENKRNHHRKRGQENEGKPAAPANHSGGRTCLAAPGIPPVFGSSHQFRAGSRTNAITAAAS